MQLEGSEPQRREDFQGVARMEGPGFGSVSGTEQLRDRALVERQ